MTVRAIRGATCLTADDAVEMNEAVVELLQDILMRNELPVDDVISVIFTATPDITAGFPAAQVSSTRKQIGLGSKTSTVAFNPRSRYA